MVEAVAWDLDGTLVDSGVAVPDAFVAAVAELGGDGCSRSQVIAAYDLGGPPVVLSHLLGRPVTDVDVEVYHRHLGLTVSSVRVYPGIIETLSAVGARMPMGVFTGASRGAAEMLLDHSGLGGFFSHVVTADDTTRAKPDPCGLELLSRRMEVALDGMVFIGDSPLDARAARGAGAFVIAAGWGHLYREGVDVDVVCMEPSEVAAWVRGAGARATA